MIRKTGLRLLAWAVPLVGLALLWRVGQTKQKERDESDIYEAALRFNLGWSGLNKTSKVFVSLNGRDPCAAFLRRFRDTAFKILPASTYTAKSGPNTKLPPIFFFSEVVRADGNKVRVKVKSPIFSRYENTYVLKRQDGRWTVVPPIPT